MMIRMMVIMKQTPCRVSSFGAAYPEGVWYKMKMEMMNRHLAGSAALGPHTLKVSGTK